MPEWRYEGNVENADRLTPEVLLHRLVSHEASGSNKNPQQIAGEFWGNKPPDAMEETMETGQGL